MESLKELEAKAEALQAKLDTIDPRRQPIHYNDTRAAWQRVLRKIRILKKEMGI